MGNSQFPDHGPSLSLTGLIFVSTFLLVLRGKWDAREIICYWLVTRLKTHIDTNMHGRPSVNSRFHCICYSRGENLISYRCLSVERLAPHRINLWRAGYVELRDEIKICRHVTCSRPYCLITWSLLMGNINVFERENHYVQLNLYWKTGYAV